MSATATPRKPRAKPARGARYVAEIGVLYLTVGKEHFCYWVDAVPGLAQAWVLTKFRSQGGQEYRVVLASESRPASCQCRGHLRHGTPCKHILACQALVASGKL